MKLTVEILRGLASQGKVPCVVFESPVCDSYALKYDETKNIKFHCDSKVILYNDRIVHFCSVVDKLQLKEENEKKVSEQLDNINSDIKELEIRLKKDIPELDKRLDINNFR